MFLGIAVAASFYLARAAHRPPYGFISDLNGTEMTLQQWQPSSATGGFRRCYAFDSKLSDVFPAMKGDLAAAGWKLAYQDDEYVAFIRPGKSGDDIAALEVCRDIPYGNGTGSIRSFVLLPPPTRTWLGDQIEWLVNLFPHEKKKKPPDLMALELGSQVILRARETSQEGRAQVELSWHNRTPFPDSGRVDSCFLRGYESDQSLPMNTTLGPWQTKTVTLTFLPAAAGDLRDKSIQQTHAIDCDFMTASRWRGGLNPDQLPIISSLDYMRGPGIKQVAGHTFEITNPSARAIAIKDVAFDNDGVVKYKAPGPIQVAPDGTLRIQTKRLIVGPNYRLDGQLRLLPNRRWTEFHSFPR